MVIGFSALVLLLVVLLNVIPKYQDNIRFDELINNAFSEDNDSSVAIRYRIYQCVIETLTENPLLGFGVGNVQPQLDTCYQSNNYRFTEVYNSHNQYFSIMLTVGFVGLTVFLIGLYKMVRVLRENKSAIGIFILVFFLLNFLTENAIERELGVWVYSYFMSLFLFYHEDR